MERGREEGEGGMERGREGEREGGREGEREERIKRVEIKQLVLTHYCVYVFLHR